jgi:arsenate reductase
MSKARILIQCTGNSARSQIAEGFLKSFDSTLEVYSAGTKSAESIHPVAIKVMWEIGIDISQGSPKSVDQFVRQPFDYVITVCDDAERNCPVFTGAVKKRLHIGFADPARTSGREEEVLAVFRKVRDEIESGFFDFYSKEIKNTISKP